MSDTKNFEKQLRDYKTQSSPKGSPRKSKTYNRVDNVLINKLTSELADALIEKRKCEVENDILRMENKNYHTRVKLLITEISSLKLMQGNNIMAIEQQVSNIQSQIQPKANKFSSETSLQSLQVESNLHKEIGTLNNTINDLRQNESNLKMELLRFKEKYHIYKEKLKFSVNVITNLNKHLSDKARNLKEIGCQTERENILEVSAIEEQIISDLFFRDRPYHDDDNLIFLIKKQSTEVVEE